MIVNIMHIKIGFCIVYNSLYKQNKKTWAKMTSEQKFLIWHNSWKKSHEIQ